MARKALYKHATQVNTSSYPDDGSSPVGSNEWNEAPDPQGMLGFTPATATITIASGVATVTDTITVVAAESGTSDVLDKLAITNTNQYDLVYLFADTGDTITLTNTSSPSADGQIKTISNANETLSSTVPTILIRKGNYWYGYGGGVVNALNDVGDVTITGAAQGDVIYYTGSAWVNLGAGTSGHFLKTQGSGANPVWASAGGGATATHAYTNQSSTSYRGTGSSGTGIDVGIAVGTEASGAGEREIYIRKIDANNEGVFTVIHKNGTTVEVQIA